MTLFGRSASSLLLSRSIALEWLALCLSVCMIRKSTASEWFALFLISFVLGDAAPWLTDVADVFDNSLWQGDRYLLSSMVVSKP